MGLKPLAQIKKKSEQNKTEQQQQQQQKKKPSNFVKMSSENLMKNYFLVCGMICGVHQGVINLQCFYPTSDFIPLT